jgi:pyrroloquinoline-quinone synthase
MDAGALTREELQRWVTNRFYYQKCIPLKDAAILANCPEVEVRRQWIQRIVDHDGTTEGSGGTESWLRLGEALGVPRAELMSERRVLPAVRYAVDAYVNFARHAPWQEAVCSSLTELFAPEIHKQRLATWPEHYKWIEPEGLQYFRNRIALARRDVEQGLAITLDHFKTRAQQERALQVLQFKLDILWAMNDAMALRYGVNE